MGRIQSIIQPGTPRQHVPLPTEVLGQTGDTHIGPGQHVLIHYRRERVIHHQIKTVPVGQTAQGGQIGPGQQRIGRHLAKQRGDGGFAQLPFQGLQFSGISAREEQVPTGGEPLLDLQCIDVREAELGRGQVGIQPPDRPPDCRDRRHSRRKQPHILFPAAPQLRHPLPDQIAGGGLGHRGPLSREQAFGRPGADDLAGVLPILSQPGEVSGARGDQGRAAISQSALPGDGPSPLPDMAGGPLRRSHRREDQTRPSGPHFPLDQLPDQGVQAEPGIGRLQLTHDCGISLFVADIVVPERQTGRNGMFRIGHRPPQIDSLPAGLREQVTRGPHSRFHSTHRGVRSHAVHIRPGNRPCSCGRKFGTFTQVFPETSPETANSRQVDLGYAES